MKNGIFIVFDGLDGSGKSTIAKMLQEYLSSKKHCDVLLTREPTGGQYGREIRNILSHEENPNANAEKMLGLFLKDRKEHLKNEIVPFLSKKGGKKNVVICDRYYYSTISFQSTQGIDVELLIEKNKGFLKPDIAFIMDITPEDALERIKNRKKEKFEQYNFMKELREKFLQLPDIINDNIKVIDASASSKEVLEQVKKEIEKII